VRYLGRSGSIAAWGEQMKTLSKEERPVVGKLLNEVRNAVTASIAKPASVCARRKKQAS
jgi:phenylalanyl-tRNA synthetase alpha chain